MMGDITFDTVHFRYGAGRPVFNNLQLQLRKGEITAVVGERGSGKTSLLSLLHGIYPIQAGNIHIGSMDLRYLRTERLRTVLGVVPHRLDLFGAAVLEIISVGGLEAAQIENE